MRYEQRAKQKNMLVRRLRNAQLNFQHRASILPVFDHGVRQSSGVRLFGRLALHYRKLSGTEQKHNKKCNSILLLLQLYSHIIYIYVCIYISRARPFAIIQLNDGIRECPIINNRMPCTNCYYYYYRMCIV